MLSQLTKTCFPPTDAAPQKFRIAGIIFLVVALVSGATVFVLFMRLGQMQLLIPFLLLPMIVWLAGAHRIFWGGTVTANRWLSAGRVALTALVGYVSLMVISGLVGAVAGLIKGSA